MKIGIVTSSYHPYYKGGGEYSVKMLAEGLAKLGINVFVISAYKESQKETIIDGVKVYRLKSPNIYWSGESETKSKLKKVIWHLKEGYSYKVQDSFKAVIENEQPDLIHIRNVSDFPSSIWKYLKTQGVPSVLTLNSYASLCVNANLFRDNKVCEQRCVGCQLVSYPKKVYSKYIDAVVGVSEFTLNKHLQYGLFNNAKKYVIRTHVPMVPSVAKKERENLTFGFIGQLNPNKGVKELITAFKSVENNSIRLLIAGDTKGDYYNECCVLAQNDKRIDFLGRVEADSFYTRVDVVAIPSVWYEPFPRVLVEAYSHGKPVITTGQGGIKEMVYENITGFVYNTTSDLSCIIRKIANDGVDFFSFEKNIRKNVNSDTSTDIENYISVYQDILSK